MRRLRTAPIARGFALLGVTLTVVACTGLRAPGGARAAGEATATYAPVPTDAVPTSTVPTFSAAPTSAAPTPAAPTRTATPRPRPSAAPPPASRAESGPAQWRMPDLVGHQLQEAQDAIQALTDNRIFFTWSHDATGAGRRQVLDRDWKVCDQNVRPGAVITVDTVIDFGAVKLTEHC